MTTGLHQPESEKDRLRANKRRAIRISVVLALPFVLAVGGLFALTEWQSLLAIGGWFDPIYYLYNVLLLLVAILIVPVVTCSYVVSMREVKLKRLERELSPRDWQSLRGWIEETLDRQFRIQNYTGSMITLMVVIFIGASIILLLKPLPYLQIEDIVNSHTGVDFGRGTNFLILGPYAEDFMRGEHETYYHQVVISLTAFQFGFLGAFVYFISNLTRSYFTLDLRPSTFIAASLRMVISSLLALVLSFVIGRLGQDLYFLPVVSFFIGHFPERGLLFLEKVSIKTLRLDHEAYTSVRMARLQGMSYTHEARLTREGYDNMENLAHAIPLDLALRTGFSYYQLRQWIGQAWLWNHLGDQDYERFKAATGIISAYELNQVVAEWEEHGKGDPFAYLATDGQKRLVEKVCIVTSLFQEQLRSERAPLEPLSTSQHAEQGANAVC